MYKLKKALAASSIILALSLQSTFMFFSPVLAKADNLVIEDNGSIVLIITDGSAVLAAQSSKKAEAPTDSKSNQTKVVVPPKSESTVKIDPKPSSDNKVKITVETQAAQNAPKPQTVVDKVILNGPDQKPIITISGSESTKLNIQNGQANLSTSLPIQVDNNVAPDGTVSHDLGVTTSQGPVKLSVLPDIAVKSAQSEVINPSLAVSKVDVSLTNQTAGLVTGGQDPTYSVREKRKGKILGLINITFTSEVQISATTGRTTSTWQSPLSILGFLAK